jgi:hypothetical protein
VGVGSEGDARVENTCWSYWILYSIKSETGVGGALACCQDTTGENEARKKTKRVTKDRWVLGKEMGMGKITEKDGHVTS